MTRNAAKEEKTHRDGAIDRRYVRTVDLLASLVAAVRNGWAFSKWLFKLLVLFGGDTVEGTLTSYQPVNHHQYMYM